MNRIEKNTHIAALSEPVCSVTYTKYAHSHPEPHALLCTHFSQSLQTVLDVRNTALQEPANGSHVHNIRTIPI